MRRGEGPAMTEGSIARCRTWRQWSGARDAVAFGIGTIVLALTLVACGGSSPKPQVTITAYLNAWSHRDFVAMAALVEAPPADFVTEHSAVEKQLGVTAASYQAGPVQIKGAHANAPLTSHLTLAALGRLDLTSTLSLHLVRGHWLVAWTSRTIANQLGPGDRFSLSQTWPARAPILGAAGSSLTPDMTTVTVGLQGSGIKDPAGLQAALVQAGLDPAKVAAAIAAAGSHPNDFETIQTLTQAQYLPIQAAIHPLPGTRFHTQTQLGALTPDLAAHVVGTVGPITADQLAKLGAPYQATDRVGQNGLEQIDEHQLAGTPAVAVKVVDGSGATVATLATTAGHPGQPLQTSIDPHVQQAAAAALAATKAQAAVVVVRASTGEVLASVSHPTSQPFDLALDGEVPPGSTFKVITASALLKSGIASGTETTCPPTISVGGRTFHNFEKEALATLTFAQAFAVSCNTAFISLASHLASTAVPATATTYGIGARISMGLPAFAGSVPDPADAVEQAATAIGQGRVVVSPLIMAEVAGAVGSGSVHHPRLVTGAPDDTAAAQPLDPALLAQLRPMMAAVVTSGTAAGAGLPAGTFAKTGTAEFGAANPPATHAWLIGYRGDLAFAVLFYGGGIGGAVAAPIASKLLTAIGP